MKFKDLNIASSSPNYNRLDFLKLYTNPNGCYAYGNWIMSPGSEDDLSANSAYVSAESIRVTSDEIENLLEGDENNDKLVKSISVFTFPVAIRVYSRLFDTKTNSFAPIPKDHSNKVETRDNRVVATISYYKGKYSEL